MRSERIQEDRHLIDTVRACLGLRPLYRSEDRSAEERFLPRTPHVYAEPVSGAWSRAGGEW